jgi:hypothetical protein
MSKSKLSKVGSAAPKKRAGGVKEERTMKTPSGTKADA